MLANGIDPNQDKRDRKLAALDAAGNTFGGLAQEWVEVKLSGLTEATIERNTSVLNLHLLPHSRVPITPTEAPALGLLHS